MGDYLSLIGGLGQAAITVATLSFAVVFGIASMTHEHSEKLRGFRSSTRLFTVLAIVVVAVWCVASGIVAFFGCKNQMLVEDLLRLSVGFQVVFTMLYTFVLLKMSNEAIQQL